MNRTFIIFLQIALFLVSINISANTIKTKIKNTKTAYTSVTKQQLAEIKMKIFDITKEEYARAENYRTLVLAMDKNNTLSALEILGMYAETKAEKRKYARKFAKLFYQYTDRVLGFQKLVRRAHKDLYGNQSMFDYVPVQKQQSKPKRRTSKTIDLSDCNQLCEDNVKELIKLAIIFPVDLYFRNATDFKIQQWAFKLEIDRDIVNKGFITLNHAY